MKKLLNSSTPSQASKSSKADAEMSLDLTKPLNLNKKSLNKDLFNAKCEPNPIYERSFSESSISSNSSNSSLPNEEKLKEAIRKFAAASDSANAKLNDSVKIKKTGDNQAEASNETYCTLTTDLLNHPDIKKYIGGIKLA